MKKIIFLLAVFVSPLRFAYSQSKIEETKKLSNNIKSFQVRIPSGDIQVLFSSELKEPLVEYQVKEGDSCKIDQINSDSYYELNVSKPLLGNLWGESCHVNVKVTSPISFNLDLRSEAGSIKIQKISGNHFVHGSSIHVNLDSYCGETKVDSPSLKIEAQNLCGIMKVNSVSSRVYVSIPLDKVSYKVSGTAVKVRPNLPKQQDVLNPSLVIKYDTVSGGLEFN